MTPRRPVDRRWTAAIATGLALVTGAIAATGAGSVSVARHAYLVPVTIAAVRFGSAVGTATAGAAVLLDALFVIPDVGRVGVTAETAEGLVTFGLLLLVGGVGGALAGQAAGQRRRYETLLATQRALAEDVPLDVAVRRVRACLAQRLEADALAVVVRDGGRLVVAGGDGVAPGSAVAHVMVTGRPVFVPYAGGGHARPRRAAVVPLTAAGATVGALAVERTGEVHRGEREALGRLGAHVGLALENARLASRHRRFADELAEKVAAATRRLEDTDRMKSAFLAIASHELRTPLTALQGFTELLATREFPRGEVRRLAGIVHAETERLTRIVSDFLDLSHVERGLQPSLRRTPVAVPGALRAAAALLEGQSRAHRLRVECEERLPPVDADADALDRILKNLITNAVKYSPPGSEVRVRARTVGAGVEFSVEDDGRGIPPEALPRVFEPYYRAPGAAETARGSGIGLAVVKSLVDAHGGSIVVDSAPMRGTRITFVLPSVP